MINVKEETLINDLLLKYCSIIDLSLDEIIFFYKGKILSKDTKMSIKELKDINIIISVQKIKKRAKEEKLNNIICPKCKNLAVLNFEEDRIRIDNCKNKHTNIFYGLKKAMNSQNINIKCVKCNNNHVI